MCYTFQNLSKFFNLLAELITTSRARLLDLLVITFNYIIQLIKKHKQYYISGCIIGKVFQAMVMRFFFD